MDKPLAMIIEDDRSIGEIFELALKDSFRVEKYRYGKSAMTRLDEVTPSIIILDLHLPDVPGRKILEIAHKDPKTRKPKVILATADAVQADFLREAVDIVLIKPISPIQLRQLASRLIKEEDLSS